MRQLLGAMAVSQTGDWLYGVALVVFVFDATHSVGWVSVSVVARMAAYMSCSAVGGALADRFDRRRWMIGINLAQAGVLSAMAVVAALDGPVAVVIALSFCAAALSASYHPAVFATVPVIVGEDDLAAANAAVATIEQIAMAAGPALGALVVALTTSAAAFALDAVSFLGGGGARRTGPRRGTRRGWGRQRRRTGGVDAGAARGRYPCGDRLPRSVGRDRDGRWARSLPTDSSKCCTSRVSSERLGTGSGGVGVMGAAYGIGGIIASLVVGHIAGRQRPVPFMAATLAISGLSLAALAVISVPAVAYGVLFVGGAAFVIFDVVSVTVLQRAIDPKLMGRVFGLLMTFGATATLTGSLVAPVLAGISLQVALVVGGLIPTVVLCVVAPRLAALDRVAAARAKELEPRLAVLSQLGVFDGAGVPALERLAATLTERSVLAGAVVVREGDIADALYVVRDGTFDVTVARDATAIKIDELHTNDWFGEVGLVQRIARTATVTATTDGLIWQIEGDDFLAALDETSGLAGSAVSLMTARLTRARTARSQPAG